MKDPQTTGSGTWLAVALITLAVLICWAWSFRWHGHDWGGDFSLYIAHARNIAEGRDYNAVNYIPEKAGTVVTLHGPAAYPPAFPLLLSPVYRLAGLNYGAMRSLVQGLWLTAGLLIWLTGVRRGLGQIESATVAGVFLLSSMVLGIKDSILSESTYLVLSLTALLFLERLYREKTLPERHPLLYGSIAGALLLAGWLTRVTGISLVIAFALCELWSARRIRAFALAAGAVFVTGLLLYRFTLYDGTGYANQFGLTPGIWLRNTVAYLKSPALLWGSLPAALRYPAALVALLLAAAGFVRCVRSSLSVMEFYAVIYMIPLLLYSSGVNSRYIVPIYPFILIYCAFGLRLAMEWAPPRTRKPVLAAIALLLAAGAAANSVAAIRAPEPDGPELPPFQEVAGYLRRHAAPEDVVISWNPRVVALYTERVSAAYPNAGFPQRIAPYLSEIHAKWVLTFRRDASDTQWLIPYVTSHPDQFAEVLRNQDFVLYRVRQSR